MHLSTTLYTTFYTETQKMLNCEFEENFACGFKPLIGGRVQWERTSVQGGDRSQSPLADASGSQDGDYFAL